MEGIGGQLVRYWRARLRGEGQIVSRREVWRRFLVLWANAKEQKRAEARVTVRKLAALYYKKPGNEPGGRCHIVLDDDNLEDRWIQYCLDQCAAAGDVDGADLLLALLDIPTEDERRDALGPYPFTFA